MKKEYPKMIYHPTEPALIIAQGPVPEGWFEHPDCNIDDAIATETEVVDMLIEDMTKKELEDFGREFGLELDLRKKRETLIAEVREAIE